MNIDVKGRGFTLTEVLRGYVQRRLYFALGRYSDRIERVAFVLEEVAGPSEGLDYKSQIRVEASDLPPFARFLDDRQPPSRDLLFQSFRGSLLINP